MRRVPWKVFAELCGVNKYFFFLVVLDLVFFSLNVDWFGWLHKSREKSVAIGKTRESFVENWNWILLSVFYFYFFNFCCRLNKKNLGNPKSRWAAGKRMIDREEPFLVKCSRSFYPVSMSKCRNSCRHERLSSRFVWHIFSSLLRTSLAQKLADRRRRRLWRSKWTSIKIKTKTRKPIEARQGQKHISLVTSYKMLVPHQLVLVNKCNMLKNKIFYLFVFYIYANYL